jgi:hypothetical protein
LKRKTLHPPHHALAIFLAHFFILGFLSLGNLDTKQDCPSHLPADLYLAEISFVNRLAELTETVRIKCRNIRVSWGVIRLQYGPY